MYSLPIGLSAGLKAGLPWSALLVAIIPVLGMSWFIDTENWAAGVWDSWASMEDYAEWSFPISSSIL